MPIKKYGILFLLSHTLYDKKWRHFCMFFVEKVFALQERQKTSFIRFVKHALQIYIPYTM